MLHLISTVLKAIFRANVIEQPAPQAVPESKDPSPFDIQHEWPFPSPRPQNTAYLLTELVKGTVTEGDHTFFVWGDEKRRHIRTPKGTETMMARNIVWWMFGRKVPNYANGLTTNCGEEKCIKLSHLILRTPQVPYGPETKPEPVEVQPLLGPVAEPVEAVQKATEHHFSLDKPTAEDRTKCISCKVYYPSMGKAKTAAREYNSPEVRGKGGRYQYAYDCDLCDGYHLTKHNPAKFKGKKMVGAW